MWTTCYRSWNELLSTRPCNIWIANIPTSHSQWRSSPMADSLTWTPQSDATATVLPLRFTGNRQTPGATCRSIRTTPSVQNAAPLALFCLEHSPSSPIAPSRPQSWTLSRARCWRTDIHTFIHSFIHLFRQDCRKAKVDAYQSHAPDWITWEKKKEEREKRRDKKEKIKKILNVHV